VKVLVVLLSSAPASKDTRPNEPPPPDPDHETPILEHAEPLDYSAHGRTHDDGHRHGSSALSRLRHGLSELVGGPSHDAADQVDDVLEADAAGRRALLISLALLAVTAAIQAVVVVLSGSVALLGDTLHNVADALTAVPLPIAFRLARRPATKRFTYGYGRAETWADCS
jgi:Co/Zn/Cd efflux system component